MLIINYSIYRLLQIVESRPSAQLVEQSSARALGVHVLAMADDVILLVEAETVYSAEQQVTERLQSRLGWFVLRVCAQEAHSQRLLVEAGGVQALVIPATSLVDGSIVSDAEVVGDISPAEHVRVQSLEVTHLSGAGFEGIAVVASRVVNHYPRSGAIGQWGVRPITATPSRLCVDIRAN